MAASKWPQVREKMGLIEQWCKSGLTEHQIAQNLGISRSSLNEYKNKHKELADAIRNGRRVAVAELENALYRRALGFNYETLKTSIRMINGMEVRYTEKTIKYMPADVGAIIFLLKNKDRSNWSDSPQKRDLEREIFEFNKQLQMARVYGDEES